MNSTRHPLPVDWWLSAFNVAMAVIWTPFIATHPSARLLLGSHLLAATLPWLLARAPIPQVKPLRLLYDAYPLAWIAAFWAELDLHTRLVTTLRDDRVLLSLDRTVFGVHLNQAWLATMHGSGFSELMHFFYFSYYILLVGVPLALILGGTEAHLREGVLRFVLAYLGCIIVHAWWPTIGPAMFHVRFPTSVSRGWFFRVNHWIQGEGDSLGTAFPSTHVAGAVTFAWIAWRFWSRPVAGGLTLLATGIVGATVYTQNHFAVDSLAGVLLGLGFQGFVVPLFTTRSAWDTPPPGPSDLLEEAGP